VADAGDVQFHLAAERAVSRISSSLITTEIDRMGEVARHSLAELGALFGVDRAYLLAFGEGSTRVALAEEWYDPPHRRVLPALERMAEAAWQWWGARLATGAAIVRAPDDLADAPAEVAATFAEEGIGAALVVPVRTADGISGVLTLLSADPAFDANEESVALLSLVAQSFVNRMDRARAEEALASLSRELEAANAELLRSNRELEDFAYVASHDLKSPLLVVEGFLELLATTKADVLDDEARSFVDAALRGSRRMNGIIDDLLTYSRAGQPRELADVDLADVARDAVDDIGMGGEATIVLEALPVVRGDAAMLRQLFDNLLTNACKFVEHGTRPTVVVGARREPGAHVLFVEDNGIGIPEEDRERALDMFTRLEHGAARPGSGIGLAICKRVAIAHGGAIWIEGRADAAPGTRVCVRLPAA